MPKSNKSFSMDHAIKVYVSPANNSSEYLESISTQSTGDEEPGEKLDELGTLVNEELNELQKTSGQISEPTNDEDDDEVFIKTEDIGDNNIPKEMENEDMNKSPSALAQVARTLQMVSSWLNRTRTNSDNQAPRVDSFLEKLEMAGPSHFTGDNTFTNASSSSIFVDPSHAFHFYWLMVVTICVLYNWIFIIARAAFADLQSRSIILWLVLDYVSDLVYIVDMVIQFKTGK